MMLAKKKILGDYHIGKTIGQGAFSKVKIGYHIETGQKVAIKVIDKRQMEAKAKKAKQAHEDRERRRRSDDKGRKEKEVEKGTGSDIPGGVETGKTSSFVSSLQTEVQLLMRLDHPNVIRLYQVMESEDECFVVMEYASGGELIDYIAAKGNLTEKEARRFFRQMVSALDHCHQANVVHRDLKLENLLLNSERNLLISDFGLGRTFNSDSEDLMRTFCGTPNYAAVELISGIPYVGVKSDIWAMGVVLYVMMTGRPPFVGENISSLYSKIKAVDYKCPSYFSQELRNLLGKLLVRDPKQRADMEAIRHDAWVNYEEIELPLQISPKIIGNVDPSLIGQFISSIHHDQAFIIYTFRSHTLDADRLAGIKKQALRRQSKANALEKPRISTTESERSRTNSIITDMTNSRPSIVKGSRRLSLGGSNLGSTPISPAITSTVSPPPSITLTPPNVTATYPSNSRLKRRSTITGDQASSFNAQNAPPVITIEGNEKFDLTPPIATWNSGTRSRSMNRQRNASQPVNPQPPLSPQPAQKVSGGRRNTVTNIGNGMCTPVSLAPTDRDLTIIRRMSQVGPTGDLVIGLTEPQQKNSGPSSFSSGMDVSGNVIRHRRGHSASGPDDLDPMTGTDEDLVEMDEPEISNKEIEDWHLLHRPPKTIRTVRFTFNSNTTSSLAAFMVFQEVHRVLVCLQLQHGGRLTFTRPDDLYLLNCKLASTLPEDNVEFEVEVCKLWLLKLHGVRIKRLSGNPFIFKDVYNMLVSLLKL